MPLNGNFDHRTTSLYAILQESPPENLALADTFFPVRGDLFQRGTHKVRIERQIDEHEIAQFSHWRLDGLHITGLDSDFVELEPAYSEYDQPYDMTMAFEPQFGEARQKSAARRELEYWLKHAQRINARWKRLEEWMAAEALVNGEITINGRGFDNVKMLAFGRDPLLQSTVAPADDWTKATSNPIRQIETKCQYALEKHGVTYTDIIMGSKVHTAWRQHDQTADYYGINLGKNAIQRFGPKAPSLKLKKETLDWEGIRVWTYDAFYNEWDKTSGKSVKKRYFPDNAYTLIDRDNLGGTSGYGSIMHAGHGYQPTAQFHHPYSTPNGKQHNMLSATAPICFMTNSNAASTTVAVL